MPQNKPEMPQSNDGGVTKKVKTAKKVLDRAWASNVSGRRPPETPAAPIVTEPTEPKPLAPSAGLLGEAASAGEGIKMAAEQAKDIPKMHKGGKVKEDGPKDLEAGESVLPKDKKQAEKIAMAHLGKKAGIMSSAQDEEELDKDEKEEKGEKPEKSKKSDHGADKGGKKGHKPPRFHKTEVEHHPNGSHTIRHIPHPPKMGADGKMPEAEPEVSYAANDLQGLHDGLDANLGEGGGATPAAPAEPGPAL
jgi:hypothetical protein